jgi:hypothetical protein
MAREMAPESEGETTSPDRYSSPLPPCSSHACMISRFSRTLC